MTETAPSKPLHPWEITPRDVAAKIARGEQFLFVDCRTADEHEESRIDGTKLMPMQDLDLHMDELRQHKDKEIIVHCRSGKRSLTVTTMLRSDGFANVKSMAGGIERWAAEIDPNVKRS